MLRSHRKIKEINTGIYCVEMPLLFTVLKTLTNNNAQGEYYLTDLLSKLNKEKRKLPAYVTPDSDMVMGINSRRQMADAEKVMRQSILNDLMDSGVTIMDPASTFIEKTVRLRLILLFILILGCKVHHYWYGLRNRT
jgi:bifunctional UDP-N-acetylglucosamine pyrophosphorylase/glucosamine-1-phosphate N-acetyltransferase